MIGRPLSVRHIDLCARFHLLQRGLLPGRGRAAGGPRLALKLASPLNHNESSSDEFKSASRVGIRL
jgi:hypothetical protein